MTDEKILERVQRLLAMAGDVSSPHEAAIAARRAESIMREHNLSEADVILKEMTCDDIVELDAETGYTTIPPWMRRLAGPISMLMDCEVRAYVSHRRKTITYLGQKEDAQAAAWIFSYLVECIQRLSKKYRTKQRKLFGAGHGTNMDDYRKGIVQEVLFTIGQMIEEKTRQLAEHTSGTALVIRKKDLIENKFGETTYRKPDKWEIQDSGAFLDGINDGKTIRINQAIGADEAKERLN